MKVILIASTELYYGELGHNTPYRAHPIRARVRDADELAEVAGRLCYQSWGRPNPKTATNEGYLANILRQGHESVLEHASVTFYVEGVSRALLAELTRHRHLSFSVVSQRYVDASQLDMVRPPVVDELDTETRNRVSGILETQYQSAQQAYKEIVEILTEAGYKRKQAREAARAVLPNDTASPLIVTGNIRAWRWVIQKRYHPAADKEIQRFAKEILKHLRQIAPNSVQDLPAEDASEELVDEHEASEVLARLKTGTEERVPFRRRTRRRED